MIAWSRVRLPAGALPGNLGQLSLMRGAFTCVRWQVTLCDPIWQVTSRSSRTSSRRGLYSALTLTKLRTLDTSDPEGVLSYTPIFRSETLGVKSFAHLLLGMSMKELWKSIYIWGRYGQEYNVSFVTRV